MTNNAGVNLAIRRLVIVLMCCLAMPMSGQDGLRPRGDVNCDWDVNIADVNVLVDAVTRGVKYHSFYTYCLDVNGDQEINIADINMMVDGILRGPLAPMPCYSGTLPVLFINTAGYRDIVSKEEYLQAQWWLDPMGQDVEAFGSKSNPLSMLIKGHGNYTWDYCDKKPFRLKLDDKCGLMGLPASRHWVIKANAYNWKGNIEDPLPFEIGRKMGMSWNPHIKPIEVVMNGEYIGLYFLYEKIRVEKHRVDIQEQRDGETDPDKVTGGWLLEINNYNEPDNIVFTEGNGKPFYVRPHSPEALSGEQKSYITQLLQEADRAIYQVDKQSLDWEHYIDIDSLAIYYLVQEVADNLEAFSGSCYMHKDRGQGSKLIFGPLWDCDHTFWRCYLDTGYEKFIYEDVPSNWYSRWIGEIAKYPRFQERIRHYWHQFYAEVFPDMDRFMEDFAAEIEIAGNCDFKRWPQYNSKGITARVRAYAIPSFHRKVDWLQSQWGE